MQNMVITTKEKRIQNLIKIAVAESVQSVLTDPDYGLDLKESFKKRLKKYSAKNPKKLSSLEQIKKKYL